MRFTVDNATWLHWGTQTSLIHSETLSTSFAFLKHDPSHEFANYSSVNTQSAWKAWHLNIEHRKVTGLAIFVLHVKRPRRPPRLPYKTLPSRKEGLQSTESRDQTSSSLGAQRAPLSHETISIYSNNFSGWASSAAILEAFSCFIAKCLTCLFT